MYLLTLFIEFRWDHKFWLQQKTQIEILVLESINEKKQTKRSYLFNKM